MNAVTKWIIGGVVFLILFVIGCYFWYQWDTAPYRKEYAETQQIIRQTNAAQKTDTDNVTQEATKAPAESDAQPAEKPTTNATATGTENTKAEVVNTNESNTVSQAQEQNETPVRVSKFGLGPFPPLPPDYPRQRWVVYNDVRFELMDRVQLKLWEQGIRDIRGMSYDNLNGLIYLNRPNIVYVEYEYTETEDEINRYLHVSGSPISEEDVEILREGGTIPGLTVLKMSDGIEPYSFLGLTK